MLETKSIEQLKEKELKVSKKLQYNIAFYAFYMLESSKCKKPLEILIKA